MTRSLSLLEICQDAIRDVKGYYIPTTIVNNDDDAAVQLLRAATKTGRELVAKVRWQALLAEHTFATVPATSSYSLPTDYQAFANLTMWDRSNDWEMLGPATPRIWQTLQSATVSAGVRNWFRIAGNFFQLYPVPSDVRTIAYDYYSRYYCSSSGGTAQEDWAADTDLSRIDGELMTLGVCFYFKKSEGLPFAEEKSDYIAAILDYQSDDTPKGRIDLAAGSPLVNPLIGNLPETGYGS
jgi:hypothetical protein